MHLIQVIDDNARFRFNIQAVERLFRILYSLLDFETLRPVFSVSMRLASSQKVLLKKFGSRKPCYYTSECQLILRIGWKVS